MSNIIKALCFRSVDKYYLGSDEKNFYLEVEIINTGEDSFESTLLVKHSGNVLYNRVINEHPESSFLSCDSDNENNTLKCEIGNPLPKDRAVLLKIFWEPTENLTLPTYDFSLFVNSTNQEEPYTLSDNLQKISVEMWSNSRLDVGGKSYPREIFFNESQYTVDTSHQSSFTPFSKRLEEQTIGPQVIHVYYLKNEGSITINETEVIFVWPATIGQDDLLYLLEPPHFSPGVNVRCNAITDNYKKFQLHSSEKSIFERLNLAVEDEGLGKVEAVVGGGEAKIQTSIDKEVESSGDASRVHEQRHGFQSEVTSSGPTQISSTSTKFTFNQNGGDQIISSNATHYRTNSGVFVSSTGQMVSQGQGGTWGQTGTTNNLYSSSEGKFSTTGGFSNQNSEGKYQHQQVGNQTFVYRCLQRINGVETEVECGPNFTMPRINPNLLQGASSVQTECFEQFNGIWQPAPCSSITKQEGTSHISGGSTGNTINVYHRCKEERDGRWQEIECGPGGSFPDLNSPAYQSRYGGSLQGVGHSVNIVHECFKTTNGVQRKVECEPDASWTQYYSAQRKGGSYNTQQRVGSTQQTVYQGGYNSGGSNYNTQGKTTYPGVSQQNQSQQRNYNYEREEYEKRRLEQERRQWEQQQQSRVNQETRYGSQYDHRLNNTQSYGGQQSYEQRIEYERQQRERAEYERQQRERIENERVQRERAELERQQRERELERQRVELERQHRERAEAERRERERLERERSQHSYDSRYDSRQTQYGRGYATTATNLDEGSYEDVSYEYEDEENNGKPGYLNPAVAPTTRRDPHTYGSYDQTGTESGLGAAALGKNKFTAVTLDLGQLQGKSGQSGINQGRDATGQWRQESHWSKTQEIPPTYFNTVERDNVPTDTPANRNRHYGRKKRQVYYNHISVSIEEIKKRNPCKSVQCVYMGCVIENLEKDQEVSIALRARINARVLRNVS